MTIPSIGRPLPDAEGHRAVRAPRRGSMPLLSVVVASNRDWHLLQGFLARLIEPCLRLRAEVVVARAAVGPEIDTLTKMYPSVAFVEGPVAASIAELRVLGIRAATGDIVVFAEDSGIPDAEWFDTFAHRAKGEGTGAAANAPHVEGDWSAFVAQRGSVPKRDEGHPDDQPSR